MHESVLPPGSRRLLDAIERSDPSLLEGWILAGGTGLALHLGHRRSEDFDFFRSDGFDIRGLADRVAAIGRYEHVRGGVGDLTARVRGVKLSFFVVPEPFLEPLHPHRSFAVAHPVDIALMKLVAIAGRGSRKDFVDLYFLLRDGLPLTHYFSLLDRRYGPGRINAGHVLRSLTWFDDAEAEPEPEMLAPFRWDECKRFFVRAAHRVVLP